MISIVAAIVVYQNRSQALTATPPLAGEEADSGAYHYSNLLWITPATQSSTDGSSTSNLEFLLHEKDRWY
jgi:hypothetical protein